MRLRGTKLLMAAVVGTGLLVTAPAQDRGTEPDNTKQNKRDRKKSEPTADQQKENVPDRELARAIRRSITDDKTLSMSAHNVKVIVQHGMVTLKGPVDTDQEKKAVASKAEAIAGAAKVTNEITVKGDTADRKK